MPCFCFYYCLCVLCYSVFIAVSSFLHLLFVLSRTVSSLKASITSYVSQCPRSIGGLDDAVHAILIIHSYHPLVHSIAVHLSDAQTENGFSPPSATQASITSSPPMTINPPMRSARSLSPPARDRNRCSSRARREVGSCRLGAPGRLVS